MSKEKDLMKNFAGTIKDKNVTVIGLDCMYHFSMRGDVTSIENVTVKYHDGTKITVGYEIAKNFKIGSVHQLKVDF